MKGKITFDIPSREKLLAGLTPRDLHPQLTRAEEAATKAEQAVERARRDLAEQERIVRELPARIQRGEVKASALAEALRERDARALLIAPAEDAARAARARVPVEAKAAAAAVEREVVKRTEQLERLARELSPLLDELRELSLALSRVLNPQSLGMADVDWPCGLNCDVGHHIRNVAAGGGAR